MATIKDKNNAEHPDWPVIRLPRVEGVNAPQQIFVGVNFKNYLVKTGESVAVPPEVYRALMDSQEAEDVAAKFAEEKKLKTPNFG